MKSQSLIKGAAVVAAGGLLSKAMGAVYRILLMDALGGRGMGIYQMVFPFYCLLLTLSATGIPSALARMVAERRAAGEDGRSVLAGALPLFTAIGGLGSAAMFFLAPALAAAHGEAAAASAYRMLAPAVLLVAALSCLRGWLQGCGRFAPTAASEVVEQAVKIAFGLFFVRLYRGDAARAVGGAVLAVTLGELAALAFLAACARRPRPFFPARRLLPPPAAGGRGTGGRLWGGARPPFAAPSALGRGEGLPVGPLSACRPLCVPRSGGGAGKAGRVRPRALLRAVLPVAVAAGALPLTNLFESILIVRMVGRYAENATALYGLYAGAATSLVNLPVSVCYGLAAASIPAVASLRAAGRGREAEERALFALKCTLYLALPASALLFAFSAPVCALLFRLPEGEMAVLVRLVRLLAIAAAPLAAVQTLSACLTGLGRPGRAALSAALACALRLGAEFALLSFPQISVFGAAYACIGCYLVAFLLDLYYSIKERKNRIAAGGQALKFALLAAASACAAWPLRGAFPLAQPLLAGGLYLALSVPFRAFGAEELRSAWRKPYDRTRRAGVQPRRSSGGRQDRPPFGRPRHPAHGRDARRGGRARARRPV